MITCYILQIICMTVFAMWHDARERVLEVQLLLGFISHREGTLSWRHGSSWYVIRETLSEGGTMCAQLHHAPVPCYKVLR